MRRSRRLSLTSLIDVIFLLLLFFMLSSTFTRFAEVPLTGTVAGDALPDEPPRFLQLGPERLRLDGTEIALTGLAQALADTRAAPVLVSLQPSVTAQRLTDLLVVVNAIPGLTVTLLGPS